MALQSAFIYMSTQFRVLSLRSSLRTSLFLYFPLEFMVESGVRRMWFLFSFPRAARAEISKASRALRGHEREEVSTYVVACICLETPSAYKESTKAELQYKYNRLLRMS
ncbi:hypothetical protein TNIN_289841 [Trichonephila inaurata madagascariensis]|uniref:Uncharacterized protein n=1 Tax=Trichonephila inaurata madagascariensis TaxID=2747483 RepID=A0A8X6XNL2_9ARAC|nr:hypothetical protein TNIN_289841 [Trichonephila inaurata madagascariensis]